MSAYLISKDSTGATSTLKFDVVTDESWDLKNTITEHPVETGADVADNVRVGLAACSLTVFVTNEPFKQNSFTATSKQSITIGIAGPAQAPANPTLTLVAQEWDNGLSLRTILQGVGALGGSALGGATGGLIGNVAGGVLGALLDPPHAVSTPFQPGVGLDPTPPSQVQATLINVDTAEDFPARMFSALETLRTSVALISVVGSKNYRENMVIESVSMDRNSDTGTGAEFTITLREIRFVTTQTVSAPKPTIPRAQAPVAKGPQNPVPVPAKKRESVLKKLEALADSIGKKSGGIGQGDFSVPGGL